MCEILSIINAEWIFFLFQFVQYFYIHFDFRALWLSLYLEQRDELDVKFHLSRIDNAPEWAKKKRKKIPQVKVAEVYEAKKNPLVGNSPGMSRKC